MVALGKLSEFDPATNFDSWMGQIVRFVALNMARQKRRDASALTDPAAMDAHAGRSAAAPAPAVDLRGRLLEGRQDFDDAVLRALSGLEETARACLLLKSVEGLPYAQIAAILAIPEGTAMSHVHRARKAMRDVLAPRQGVTK